MLMASTKDDIDEGSDHLGPPLVMGDDTDSGATVAQTAAPATPAPGAKIVDTSAHTAAASEAPPPSAPEPLISDNVVPATTDTFPGKGTVVIDVNGGPVVPSFVGKTMRNAVETAQQTGLELSVIGSGIARQQFPPPGSHLPAGQRVTVRFTR